MQNDDNKRSDNLIIKENLCDFIICHTFSSDFCCCFFFGWLVKLKTLMSQSCAAWKNAKQRENELKSGEKMRSRRPYFSAVSQEKIFFWLEASEARCTIDDYVRQQVSNKFQLGSLEYYRIAFN